MKYLTYVVSLTAFVASTFGQDNYCTRGPEIIDGQSNTVGSRFGRKCGNPPIPPDQRTTSPVYTAAMNASLNESSLKERAESIPIVEVQTYFHVINAAGETPPDRNFFEKQIDFMNLNYGLAFFRFNLQDVDYRVNNSWAEGGVPDSEDPRSIAVDLDMKRELRRGDYAALNIYFQSRYEASTSFYGYCTFPESGMVNNTDRFFRDGCNVDQKTLPGLSTNTTFNLGYTAVHETGHWLSLYHPFQDNTCAYDGDQVPDTPFQSTPTFGCPPRKRSCGPAAGEDSIHNIMDYADDCCIGGFTPDQGRRMLGFWFLRDVKL